MFDPFFIKIQCKYGQGAKIGLLAATFNIPVIERKSATFWKLPVYTKLSVLTIFQRKLRMISMPSPKMIRRILLTALPLIVLGGTGLYLWKNNRPKTYEVEDNRFLLDTVVSIRLYNSRNPENLEKAFERISEYEQLLSRHHNRERSLQRSIQRLRESRQRFRPTQSN